MIIHLFDFYKYTLLEMDTQAYYRQGLDDSLQQIRLDFLKFYNGPDHCHD